MGSVTFATRLRTIAEMKPVPGAGFLQPGSPHSETSSNLVTWKPVWKSKDREDAVDGPNRWLVLADAAGFADEVGGWNTPV